MAIPDPSIQWLFWGPQNTSAILCIIQVIHPSIGGSLLILWVVTIFYPPPLKGWRCEMSKPKTSKHLLVPSTSDLKGIWRILDDEGKWEISLFFPFLRIRRFRSFSVAGEIPGTEDRMCQAARRRLRCGGCGVSKKWFWVLIFTPLRIIGPSKLVILRTLPLLYRFKPFHWRVQDP